MKNKIILFALAFLFFIVRVNAACDVNLGQSDMPITLTDPNTNYCLSEDVVLGNNVEAITFGDNNITLDCQGHLIDCDSYSTVGIFNEFYPIIIKNCNIACTVGIYGCIDNSTIINNNITASIDESGIDAHQCSENEANGFILKNNIAQSYTGISSGGKKINILNNTIKSTNIGIDISPNSNNSRITGNNITSSIWIIDSDFSNPNADYFNNSFMGNIYYDLDGTPASEICTLTDSNNDGWADGGEVPFYWYQSCLGYSRWIGSGQDYHPWMGLIIKPFFISFVINETNVYSGNNVLVTSEIQNGTLSLDKWWFRYNNSLGNISIATNGSNSLLWRTSGLLGNYSLFGYVNDTGNNVNISSEKWINFYTTTTTTIPILNITYYTIKPTTVDYIIYNKITANMTVTQGFNALDKCYLKTTFVLNSTSCTPGNFKLIYYPNQSGILPVQGCVNDSASAEVCTTQTFITVDDETATTDVMQGGFFSAFWNFWLNVMPGGRII